MIGKNQIINETIKYLELDTIDYIQKKESLTDQFWNWLTNIEENYGLPRGANLHIKWICEIDDDKANDETALIQDELEELKRKKKLLEDGLQLSNNQFTLNLPTQFNSLDDIEIGPETARLLNYSSKPVVPLVVPVPTTVSEADRMAQLDEALATAAELFKELGLDMGELDVLDGLDGLDNVDNVNNFDDFDYDQADDLLIDDDLVDEGQKKEWPPKPKKKQWPPKPTRPSSSTKNSSERQQVQQGRALNKPTPTDPVIKRNFEEEPWTCYACNTHNTKGKFCHLCSVELLPPGYPPPPFLKQLKFPGGDEVAYKEWMRKNQKYEIWENSLQLYRKFFKEGNGQECLKILQRLKEQVLNVGPAQNSQQPNSKMDQPNESVKTPQVSAETNSTESSHSRESRSSGSKASVPTLDQKTQPAVVSKSSNGESQKTEKLSDRTPTKPKLNLQDSAKSPTLTKTSQETNNTNKKLITIKTPTKTRDKLERSPTKSRNSKSPKDESKKLERRHSHSSVKEKRSVSTADKRPYRLESIGENTISQSSPIIPTVITTQSNESSPVSSKRTWKCYICFDNVKGLTCNNCKVEKPPQNFPLPPDDPIQFDFWSESLKLYKKQEAEEDLKGCEDTLEKLNIKLSEPAEDDIEMYGAIEAVVKVKSDKISNKNKKQNSKSDNSSDLSGDDNPNIQNGKLRTKKSPTTPKGSRDKSQSVSSADKRNGNIKKGEKRNLFS